MYQLMIVDDEPEIRDGLLEIIDWAKEGFTVAGVAENGLEALQMAESMPLDLVVTDIRMPFLDGLEMARRMRQILPTVQFIILSGYDEFDYARQAIQIQIKDYILKPISSDEFTEVLRRVKIALDEDFVKRSNVQSLKEHFKASLPILRELMLTSLLSGGITAQEALASAAQYSLPIKSARYAVAVIRLNSARSGDQDLSQNPDLMRFAVMNIVSEVLQSHAKCHVFHYNDLVAVLFLLQNENEQPFSQIMDLIDTARLTVMRYLDCPMAVGVSNPVSQLSHLHRAAEQSLSALNQSALLGESQVLAIADVEPGSTSQLAADEMALRTLSNAIKMGNDDEAEEQIRCLLDEVRLMNATYQDFQVYLIRIFRSI